MDTEKIAGLTVKQSTFLTEYARTNNLTQACKVARINRSTGYSYLGQVDFQTSLQQMRSKIVNTAWTKLSSNLEGAVERVIEILNDPRTTVNAKLRGAELIFNYTARYADNRDILARMERLEDSLNAK